jgi:hypothetical protein
MSKLLIHIPSLRFIPVCSALIDTMIQFILVGKKTCEDLRNLNQMFSFKHNCVNIVLEEIIAVSLFTNNK